MPIRYPPLVLAAAMLPLYSAWSSQRPGDPTGNGPANPEVASIALNDLPKPIRTFIDSGNRGSAAAVVDCFTADATLDDFGRRFEGHAGIAAWDKTDNTGVRAHLEVASVTLRNGVYDVAVTVSGGGYNGSGHMHFVLRADRIARLTIA